MPVRRCLHKLGQDIRNARRRRRIPTAVIAERAATSLPTLRRVERGHPGVSLGTYANVLFSLGMIDRLADVSDARHDELGLMLDEEKLPERVHGSPKTPSPKEGR
ncbi:MAG: hypothetical protein KKE50_07400 [Nanoarchaeota archaeon]|nr:hypothetical protein [Nanoarchaeota archaeon]